VWCGVVWGTGRQAVCSPCTGVCVCKLGVVGGPRWVWGGVGCGQGRHGPAVCGSVQCVSLYLRLHVTASSTAA